MSNEIRYDELGWKETMLLGVAISEGPLDAISGGRWRAEVVADDLKLNARAVYTVLSALSEYGFIEGYKAGFRLPEPGTQLEILW